MGPTRVLTVRVRIDLSVTVIKSYSLLPRVPELKPEHQIQFRVILLMSKAVKILRQVLDICYFQSVDPK